MISHHIDTPLFIQMLVGGRIFFYFLAIMNSCYESSKFLCEPIFSFFLVINLQEELLGHIV
jgi:hypothetical protein